MEEISRPNGILAHALWEMRSEHNFKVCCMINYLVAYFIPSKFEDHFIFACYIAVLQEQKNNRIGILGAALEEMKHIPYSSDKINELIRPRSANNTGMIALLLETKDAVEFENLGLKNEDEYCILKDLIKEERKRASSTYSGLSVDEELTTPKKVFIPKMKSRESTPNSEENQRTQRTSSNEEEPEVNTSCVRRLMLFLIRTVQTLLSHSPIQPVPTETNVVSPDLHPSSQEETSEEKEETEQLDTLIDLSLADPQAKVLYMAKREQWSALQTELDKMKGNDFSMADQNGFTVLLLAIKYEKRMLVEKLLSRGADINVVTKDNYNAAHICAMHADVDILNVIIARNRDLLRRQGGPDLQLPIHLACARNSKKAYFIVRRILDLFEHQVLDKDNNGSLPIHVALKDGNVTQAELLLSHHAHQQSTSTDGSGDTLLHIACRSGSMDAVRVAIAAGCDDANIQNAVGRTALHEVAYLGDANLLKIMFKLHADANVLDKGAKRTVGGVRVILKPPTLTLFTNPFSKTTMRKTFVNDYDVIICMIILYFGKCDSVRGKSLHIAAERGHTSVVEQLIDKFGGSIRARTKDGSTLLHIAACSGHASTALAFLKRGYRYDLLDSCQIQYISEENRKRRRSAKHQFLTAF
ncbi:ankyrin repeat protein [Dictyocaulus viviparus]|uniref:Ankyrin repeat protein n=1 Tax=Dictyocaulus viviparus TaxID=29172 RepID=A0A0D8YAE0_DICVI|nr:ankyrin repeat protein [Dictyocaulus viviparus]